MDRLCPHCGEGLLKPLGVTQYFAECDNCRRSFNLRRLEEQEREQERKRFEGEIAQLLREDEQKGCGGGSSDARGSRKKLKFRRPGEVAGAMQPWKVETPRAVTKAKEKSMRISIRLNPVLLDLCKRHGLKRNAIADAIRAALDEFYLTRSG